MSSGERKERKGIDPKRKEERNVKNNRRVKWKEEKGKKSKRNCSKGALSLRRKEMSDRGSTVREKKEFGIS